MRLSRPSFHSTTQTNSSLAGRTQLHIRGFGSSHTLYRCSPHRRLAHGGLRTPLGGGHFRLVSRTRTRLLSLTASITPAVKSDEPPTVHSPGPPQKRAARRCQPRAVCKCVAGAGAQWPRRIFAGDSITLPPPTTEDETFLPLLVAIDLLLGPPDDVIRPRITSPLPNSCSTHSLNPPNHVDEILNPLSLRYSVTSLRSPLALFSSLFSPIRPSVPPHVSETLHGFCLRITSSIHIMLVIRIVSFIESFYTYFPRSRQVPCGHPYVQSYKILYASVL